MVNNAVIIHGWGANSDSNWFPWLKTELEKENFMVNVPNFPKTENPCLTEWLEHFTKKVEINKNTILIGHSLGVPFILRALENLNKNKKIKASYLVSGFERPLAIPEIVNFVDKPFLWEKIVSSSEKFFVINSDNDPYITIDIGKDLAKNLNKKLLIEHNAGHINETGGYLSYPRLLDLILKNSKRNI